MKFKQITNKLIDELNKIKIKFNKISLNKNFYNNIIDLYKSIELNSNNIDYKKIFIKPSENFSMINIIKYLLNRNLLDSSLQLLSIQDKKQFIQLINNNNSDELVNWINLNGKPILRTINFLVKTRKLPDNVFNNNIDSDILNEFVEFNIIDFLMNNIEVKHQYKINYKNININLVIYSNKKKISKSRINILIKIIILIGLYKNKTHKSLKTLDINIDIYMTNFNKKINKSIILGPKETNTGFTSPNYKLTIFRTEELQKVLIHELIHYLDLDLKYVNPNLISNYFNINPNNEIRLNEAYTEILALIINVSINSFLEKNKKNISLANKMVNYELSFTFFQIGKILNHYKFNNSNEFFIKYSNDNRFKQNTSIFSYFIVKGILLYNLDHLLKNLDYINNTNFFNYIVDNCNDNFIDLTNQYLKFIYINKKNSNFYNNLRLSVFEL